MDRYGGDGAFRERIGEGRRPAPRELEQRLDRWVSAGRQLVDGVAGARPGSRLPSRPAGPGRPGGLGRWLEDRIDWLIDDGDDWREPWQESVPAPPQRPLQQPPRATRRRSLEAISRRGAAPTDPTAPRDPAPSRGPAASAGIRPGGTIPADPSSGSAPGDWPDDESFTVPHWQRSAPAPAAPAAAADLTAPPPPPPAETSRPLPRSTRRRP